MSINPLAITRRAALTGVATAALTQIAKADAKPMYGLIGSMKSSPGKRDELARVLLAGINDMPGCLSYIVATDPKDPDSLWITEVWDTEASHQASLTLPSVKAAIAKGRPLIASFGDYRTTEPVGGYGLGKLR